MFLCCKKSFFLQIRDFVAFCMFSNIAFTWYVTSYVGVLNNSNKNPMSHTKYYYYYFYDVTIKNEKK